MLVHENEGYKQLTKTWPSRVPGEILELDDGLKSTKIIDFTIVKSEKINFKSLLKRACKTSCIINQATPNIWYGKSFGLYTPPF